MLQRRQLLGRPQQHGIPLTRDCRTFLIIKNKKSCSILRGPLQVLHLAAMPLEAPDYRLRTCSHPERHRQHRLLGPTCRGGRSRAR